MKYWELVADKLSKAGWSLGWVSAIDSNGETIWIVDANRDNVSVNIVSTRPSACYQRSDGVTSRNSSAEANFLTGRAQLAAIAPSREEIQFAG